MPLRRAALCSEPICARTETGLDASIAGFPPSMPRDAERGQTMIFVLLILGFFLLAAAGFAVDFANLWFHRQTAQNVADAACTAGAMDMLIDSTSSVTSQGGFTPGTAFSCSTTSSAAPCEYAGLNGFTAGGLIAGAPSRQVNVTFPASVPGVPPCTGTPPPPICSVSSGISAHPYIQVNAIDRVQIFFTGLVTGKHTVDVGAVASCGLVFSSSPVPILVLDPNNAPGTFDLKGTPHVVIYGGPQRGIQVNSSSSTAATGGGHVDTSQGGPNLSGSDFGVFGGPSSSCCNFVGGSTGNWLQPASPLSDPLAQL